MNRFAISYFFLIFAGCADPRCPPTLVQDGDVCRHCPEGTEKVGAACLPLEGGRGEDEAEATEGDAAERADASGDLPTRDAGLAEWRDAETLDAAKPGVEEAGAAASVLCFVDRDKDGIGAGTPVSCGDERLVMNLGFALSHEGGDCDDADAKRSPRATDICGDAIDNDCDGQVDEESNNACGGPCTVQLSHRPGDACDNGLQGACLKKGSYECQGTQVRCNAPLATAGTEVCGDSVDNDCDGTADESDAVDALTWYQDCDGDGYAASTNGSIRGCDQPVKAGNCGWTSMAPHPETKTTWDCNDGSAFYHSGADYGFPPSGATSYDLDCDGQSTIAPEPPSSIKICTLSTADYFNGKRQACPLSDSGECYLWKDSLGAYQQRPTIGCPDVAWGAYFDPWNDPCNIGMRSAKWPCR